MTSLKFAAFAALSFVLLGVHAQSAPALATSNDPARSAQDPRVKVLGDKLLSHMQAISADVRLKTKLPITRLDDFTPAQAQRESEFNSQALGELDKIPLGRLSHQDWLLARSLRHSFESGVHAKEDYWYSFEVVPYHIGVTAASARQMLAIQDLSQASGRDNYLHLLDEYSRELREIAAKSRAQAERGIRVPKPALNGVRATFSRLIEEANTTNLTEPARLDAVSADARPVFSNAVAAKIHDKVVPAYQEILDVFDDRYSTQAPAAVGLAQYPGGLEVYLRRINYETGLKLTPQQIHDRGLAEVATLDGQLRAIRDQLGFKGDRAAFDRQLRTDQRFFAKSPEELESHYRQALGRIEPHISEYFILKPKAPYGVKRIDAASEAGMTFGIYREPTPDQPKGIYFYNGSNLDKRALFQATHIIFHELVPGHHFQIALAEENTSLHPVCALLFQSAFVEGWAEYAAQLASEMGGYPDPYEAYGHLLTQTFLASRLVVDTGMNALGWSIDQARQYMREHDFESDELIASETLRYSTDIPAQAVDYRLGYDQFTSSRERAKAALGERFDIRAFHAAAISDGMMPLDVLEEHINWFVSEQQKRR